MTVRLRAGDVALHVDPAEGGRWTSLVVDGLELLGRATISGAYPRILYGCFPMAPYAGRMGDGLLVWRGEQHLLPRTAAPHAIHGTVLDTPWEVVGQGDDVLHLQVPLTPPWPYAGTVRQELLLSEESLLARLVVRAGQDMPVVLGLHPWFPRRLARGADAQLLVSGGRQYTRGADGLPTGELAPPLPPPWDDCFCDLDAPPRLRWPGALEVEVSSSADHWVLFDQHPDALCVEAQTGPPDAVRLDRAQVVQAGTELALEVTFTWRAA